MSSLYPSPIVSSLYRLGRGLADLVFPPVCVTCKRPGQLICDECAQAVEPVRRPFCERCGRPQVISGLALCSICRAEKQPLLSLARAAALHTDPLRGMIHHFKYGHQPELAEPLVRYLLAAYAEAEWQQTRWIDLVIPVPMFAERQKKRGYNQAELLARHFCRQSKLHYAPAALKRVRFTQPQVGLNAQERQRNVEDAFVAHPNLKGRKVLLIDDVYTTGATLRACAKVLLDAGVREVYALALATPTASE